MREGWTTARIADVANVVNGGTPKTKVPEFWGGPHLWITPAEMGNRASPYLAESRRALTDEGLQRCSASLVPPNSVILSTRAPIGHLVINTEPMAFNQGCRGLVPGKNLNDKYLYYFLSANTTLLNDLGSGTTFKELAAGKLKNVQLPVPPLDEQKRIVAILDEAFAGIETAIANTEKNLANARELFVSYLNTALSSQDGSWERVCLSDVCSITSGLVDPRDPQYADLPHVGAGNMASRTGQLANVLTAREEGLKSGKYLFDKSMVLYSKIRPYLEKVARPNMSGLCSADVYPLSPDSERLTRGFLFYMLLSKSFTDYAIAGSSRAGMPKVNREHLFQYAADLPSLDEQERIVSVLDEIAAESQRLELIFEQKLAALAELKQSLLQKAFSGELTADRAEEELESATA